MCPPGSIGGADGSLAMGNAACMTARLHALTFAVYFLFPVYLNFRLPVRRAIRLPEICAILNLLISPRCETQSAPLAAHIPMLSSGYFHVLPNAQVIHQLTSLDRIPQLSGRLPGDAASSRPIGHRSRFKLQTGPACRVLIARNHKQGRASSVLPPGRVDDTRSMVAPD